MEVVDFKLTRIHSDMNGQTATGPNAQPDSSEEEFHSFIKQLSVGDGLDQLIQNTATTSSFRYRRYKELSEFLRGLTFNFPHITSLNR